uniref:Uncharacterized protein n=1 Tax=Oryza sativa subsp. japonica TaxID=39947 RepID=Q33B09_ORYSJ|nr:hypothetical protein LOC_Os10g06150 [Oryza sativa Japonica Group]
MPRKCASAFWNAANYLASSGFKAMVFPMFRDNKYSLPDRINT